MLRQVREFGATLMATLLNADHRDCQGSQLPCSCGQQARYSGRQSKTVTTVLGNIVLERAYYHCRACGSGCYPRDEQLGLTHTSISPGVLRMIGISAAHLSFGQSETMLRELAQLRVDAKQVERSAERLGAAIAVEERNVIDIEPNTAKTRYLGMDGTGIPMRAEETAGRCGKQPDGTAKTREVKLVASWTAETLKDGKAVTDKGSVTYNGAIESARTPDHAKQISAFGQRVEREALRREFYQAERQVVIGDGAVWIWRTCQELFPKAIQIVDLYHAKDRLAKLGKAVYGAESDLLKPWREHQFAALDKGDIDALLAVIETLSERCPEAHEAAGYFERNRHRMQYAKFREQGLCVSSAVVEAGCKNAIGARLKQSGMHWSVAGANAIIALRCSVLSDRFDDYWYRRAAC